MLKRGDTMLKRDPYYVKEGGYAIKEEYFFSQATKKKSKQPQQSKPKVNKTLPLQQFAFAPGNIYSPLLSR